MIKHISHIGLLAMMGFAFILVACQSNNSEKKAPLNTHTTIPVGKGPDALFITPDEAFLYVANVEDTFISVIDLSTEMLMRNIPGVRYPWGFTRLGTSSEVAVSAYDNQIAVLDFNTHELIREKFFSSHLGGITSSEDGSSLFVVAIDSQQVWEINAQTLEMQKSFPTGSGPDGIGISKGDEKLYVTNTEDGTISVINRKTRNTDILEVGGKPELIHSSHDRTRLFVSNFTQNQVHVIDTESGRIIGNIKGLDGPEEAVLSPDEKSLYIVNFNSSEVWVYNADTYQKVGEMYKTGSKPIGLVATQNSQKLFVSNYGDNSLSIISLQ